jgi:outer membrane protein
MSVTDSMVKQSMVGPAGNPTSNSGRQDTRSQGRIEPMKRIIAALCAFAVLMPLQNLVAEQKTGFVNASIIFDQYSAAREAEEAYERDLQDLNKRVMDMEMEIRALADTLEARKYLFSEERLQEKRRDLEARRQEYLTMRQEAEVEAAKRNDELSRPIIEAIEGATRIVAEKDGFDLVLDAGPGIVVYSKPELDLTDKVLQHLEESRGSTE